MATTPRGIVTPDSGDPYDYIVDLATMADTIDDAIGDVDVSADIPTIQNDISALQTATGVKNYRWADAAERAAQTGMEKGDRGYQEDVGTEWWYSGSDWLLNMPGLNLVRPGSLSGEPAISMTDRGVVTITSATGAVGLNDVFTSQFTNYRIVFDITTTNNVVLNVRLRKGGAELTGSNYDRQLLRGIGTTASAAQSLADTSWPLITSTGAGARHVHIWDVFNPLGASPTYATSVGGSATVPIDAQASAGISTCVYRVSEDVDGFGILAPASGSFSGTIRVYGYGD